MQSRIRISLVARCRGNEKKRDVSRDASAVLSFAVHPIVFPLRSLRGRQKAKPQLRIVILTAQMSATCGTGKPVPYMSAAKNSATH